MSLDTTALVGAFQQILLTFAQLPPTQTSLYWAVVRATEQLSAVVDQRSGPLAGPEEGDTGDNTDSMNVDVKDVPDLPKKLLLEAAMQMGVPTSSHTQSPTRRVASSEARDLFTSTEHVDESGISHDQSGTGARSDKEVGDDKMHANDTSAVTAGEQKDTTTEQGKLTDHEPLDEESGQASDLDPARNDGRSNRCWQDTDTLSSSSPLSTPPTSDNEHDRTLNILGDEPTSLAVSVESSPLDGVPSRSSRSAAAKARRVVASQKATGHRQGKKRTNKTAARKEEQVASIVAGLGSPAVTTSIQESRDHAQALQSSLVFVDSADRPSGFGSPMMSLFVSLGRHLSDHSTSVWVSAVLHRINLAFFDRIYQVAKTDVQKSAYGSCGSSFLRESDALLLAQGHQPACTFAVGHRSPSVVRDRLVDLIFLDGRPNWDQSRERVRARVAAMQQLGKRWQRIIDRFGYEMLLLLPSDITSNRMKLTDGQMNVLMTLLKSGRARLSADCLAETRKAVEHTFLPYIRKQDEIFGADGGFSSLPSFHGTEYSVCLRRGNGDDSFSDLTQPDTNITDGRSTDGATARSTTSLHRPDLRTRDEDVDSDQGAVDDSFTPNDEKEIPELGLIEVEGHNHTPEV